jgi:hypothetical protein
MIILNSHIIYLAQTPAATSKVGWVSHRVMAAGIEAPT